MLILRAGSLSCCTVAARTGRARSRTGPAASPAARSSVWKSCRPAAAAVQWAWSAVAAAMSADTCCEYSEASEGCPVTRASSAVTAAAERWRGASPRVDWSWNTEHREGEGGMVRKDGHKKQVKQLSTGSKEKVCQCGDPAKRTRRIRIL
jgi:hypothetical protein